MSNVSFPEGFEVETFCVPQKMQRVDYLCVGSQVVSFLCCQAH